MEAAIQESPGDRFSAKKDLCTAKRFGFHSNKTFPAFWKTAAALRRNGSRGKRGWRGVFKNTENSSIVNQILECSNFSSKTNWMLIDDKDNNWISLKTILNHDQLKVFKIWNFKWCYVEWHNLLKKSYFQTQFHLKKNSNLATWLGFKPCLPLSIFMCGCIKRYIPHTFNIYMGLHKKGRVLFWILENLHSFSFPPDRWPASR